MPLDKSQIMYVIDPDVAMRQMDLLSDASCGLSNILVTYTVLNKLRFSQVGLYNKLRTLTRQENEKSSPSTDVGLEKRDEDEKRDQRNFHVFPNEYLRATHIVRQENESEEDRSHRAVRRAAEYYVMMANTQSQIFVLCDDPKRKEEALKEGLCAMTCSEYADSVKKKHPNALDKVADVSDVRNSSPKRRRGPDDRAKEYKSHLSTEEMSKMLKIGTTHVQGVLRMGMNTCLFGRVQCAHFDVEIKGRIALNRAVDGDVVCVRIVDKSPDSDSDASSNGNESEEDFLSDTEEEEKEYGESALPSAADVVKEDEAGGTAEKEAKQGEVVGILKQNWREYCGTLMPLTDQKQEEVGDSSFQNADRLFIPSDGRIPYIRIRTRQSTQLENKRIVVVIDSWDRFSRNPRGHWTKILGEVGDRATESAVILHEHGVVTREFSDQVLRCLPPADFMPPEEEIARRMDLRDVVVCSVDPPGCKDIDDALSCEVLPNGNYRVGVHIADVTHFVAPDSPIDVEAQERCTTVYLVEKRTDMLPSLLTTDLCSLVGGVDRLTFTVLWEMTPMAEIISKSFTKAVICSNAALSYAAAQARIDDNTDRSKITKSLRRLNSLSKILRKQRKDNGALELASQVVKFELDRETHDPLDVTEYQLYDTNRMVEEFMLLANCSVAEQILNHFPSHSVLRRHPSPKDEALSELQRRLKGQKFDNFTFESNKALQMSLDRCERPSDPYFNQLIRIMTTRCMNQAVYFCTGEVDRAQYKHYGLAMDLYTHFTSPIRRYADVLVHRLLSASLGICGALPDQLQSKERVKGQCDVINLKHRMAQWAGRASSDLHTFFYFQKKGAQVADAVVLRVRKRGGLQVVIPRFGIEGLVPMDEAWAVDEEKQEVIKEKQKITIFDHINVEILAENKEFRNKTTLTFKGLATKGAKVKIDKAEQSRIRREMFPDIIAREAN